jgi:adenylosuccinate synthase
MAELADEDREVSKLTALLEEERQAHKAQLSQLQDKLTWYAANQELLEEKAVLIARQAEEIRQLKTAAGAGPAKQPKVETLERRVKELEAQLAEMEESLRRRNPDSLVNLIRAANVDERYDSVGGIGMSSTKFSSLSSVGKARHVDTSWNLRRS